MSYRLEQFAGGYFHEDYRLDYATPDEAIAHFIAGHEAGPINELIADIDELLSAGRSEEEIDALWVTELGARYDPRDDGLTYREWFAHVRDLLSAAR